MHRHIYTGTCGYTNATCMYKNTPTQTHTRIHLHSYIYIQMSIHIHMAKNPLFSMFRDAGVKLTSTCT